MAAGKTRADYERFTDFLRESVMEDWSKIVEHPFTDALAAGTIGHDAMRSYLIQDHRFLDNFVVLLASMVAHAPTLKDRIPGCQFLALITGKENTYFERSLERSESHHLNHTTQALGVSEEASRSAPMQECTQGFLDLMSEASGSGKLHLMLSVLVVAEWSYLCWGTRVSAKRAEGLPFWCGEWIDLHMGGYFESVIAYLRGLLDSQGKGMSEEEAREAQDMFARAVRLEVAFFDHAWGLHK